MESKNQCHHLDQKELEKILGVKIQNADLFLSAFTHRSYLNENRGFHLPHNERLEFLGDAVLELVATEYLYKNYPHPEGELTNFRSALVNYKMLSDIAKRLGFEKFLLMSRGEAKDTGRAQAGYFGQLHRSGYRRAVFGFGLSGHHKFYCQGSFGGTAESYFRRKLCGPKKQTPGNYPGKARGHADIRRGFRNRPGPQQSLCGRRLHWRAGSRPGHRPLQTGSGTCRGGERA